MADGFGFEEGDTLVEVCELLRGGLDPLALPPLPTREVKTYICSTGHDMREEQRALFLYVYPKLREFCKRRLGFDFHAVDLCWGVTSQKDTTDQSIGQEMIRECQRESFGPSFVALIGQMYGGFPVPQRIAYEDYLSVRTSLTDHKGREARDVKLLDDYYNLDLNSLEPECVLNVAALQKLGKGPFVKEEDEGVACQTAERWWVEQRLRELLELGAEICLKKGEPVNLSPNSSKLISVFEQELREGLQFGPPEAGLPPASSRCVLFNRTIVDLKNFAGHPAAPKYTEVTCERGKFKGEVYSQLCLNNLKEECYGQLGPENVIEESLLFRENEGISSHLHADYLMSLSHTILHKLQSLIESSLRYPMPSLTTPLLKEVYQHWQLTALGSSDTQELLPRRNNADSKASPLTPSDTLDVIKSYVLSNDTKPLVLCGRAGSGRSTVLSKAALQIHHWVDGPVVIIVRHVGRTSLSRDLRHLLSSVCAQLQSILQVNPNIHQVLQDMPQNYDGLVDLFHRQMAHFPDNQSLVLLLDDIDLLDPDLYEPFTFHWLPRCLKVTVKVVFSVRSATPIYEILKRDVIQSSKNFLEVPVVQKQSAEQLLEWCLSERGRCLTKEQASKISEKCFQNECKPVVPLYVKLLVHLVTHWSSDVEPDQADCLPQDLPTAVQAYLEHLEQCCGPTLVARALALLTISPPGISDTEMEDLLNVMISSESGDRMTSSDCADHVTRVEPMGWIRLRCMLGGFLTRVECEGSVVRYWTHQIFAEGVRSRYIEPINGCENKIHSLLADYWLGNNCCEDYSCCNSNNYNNCNKKNISVNSKNSSKSEATRIGCNNDNNSDNLTNKSNSRIGDVQGNNKENNKFIEGTHIECNKDKSNNNNRSGSCTSINNDNIKPSKKSNCVTHQGGCGLYDGSTAKRLLLQHWQPLTYNEVEGRCAKPLYNLRKLDQLTRHLYLAGRVPEMEKSTLLSYIWIEHRINTSSLYTLLDDHRYSSSAEAHLVYRALRDADQLIRADPSCLPVELSGRLLPYYKTARLSGLKQLVVETDSACATRCGLVPGFPYRQVPGGPHRHNITCSEIPAESYSYGPDDDQLLVKHPDSPLLHYIDLLTGQLGHSVTMSRGKMIVSPSRRYAVISDYERDKTLKIHRVRDGGFLGYVTPLDKVDVHAREKHRVHDIIMDDEHICFILSTVDTSYLCIASVLSTNITQVHPLAGKATVCALTSDGCHVAVGVGERLLIYPLEGEGEGCVGDITLTGPPNIIVFSLDSSTAVVSEYCTSHLHTIHLSNGCITSHNALDLTSVHMNQHDVIHGLNLSHSQSLCLVRSRSGLIGLDICKQRSIFYIPRPSDVPVRFRLPRACQYTEDIQFTKAVFSPDDRYVVASIFRSVYVWTIDPEGAQGQQLVARLEAPIGLITSLHLTSAKSTSCHISVTCHESRVVTVWALENIVDVVNGLDRMTSRVTSLQLSTDDGKAFVSCQGSDELGVVDMQSGRLEDLFTHEGLVQSFTPSPSGRLLFVALRNSRSEMYNKIWDVPNRRVIHEFGNSPAFSVSFCQSDGSTQQSSQSKSFLQNTSATSGERYEEYFWAICQSSPAYGCPYDLLKLKVSFDSPTCANLTRVKCLSGVITYILEPPLLTASSRYMVLLGVNQELPSMCSSCFHCHAQPAICALDLHPSGDACSHRAPNVKWFGTDYIQNSLPSLKRILAVRPYPRNEFSVVVLYTNEPGCSNGGSVIRSGDCGPAGGAKYANTDSGLTNGGANYANIDSWPTEGGAKFDGHVQGGENPCSFTSQCHRYDHNFGFLIWDVCSGVPCQIIDDLIPPRTPINHLLFTDNLSFCIDDLSNIYELTAGRFVGNVLRGGTRCSNAKFSLTDVAPDQASKASSPPGSGSRLPPPTGLGVGADCCRKEEEEVRSTPPRALLLGGHAVAYGEGEYVSVWRVSDGVRLGKVCVHACVSIIKVAHDGRTLLIGCDDGSFVSYIFTDPSVEDSSQVLSHVPTRRYPAWTNGTSANRTWDRVTSEQNAGAPEYSKPPSTACYPNGRTDWGILHCVDRNNSNNNGLSELKNDSNQNGWSEELKKNSNKNGWNEVKKITSNDKLAISHHEGNSSRNLAKNNNAKFEYGHNGVSKKIDESTKYDSKFANNTANGNGNANRPLVAEKISANNDMERSRSATCEIM